MADVSFTATAIKATASTQLIYGKAGEAVARGNAVYYNSSTGEYHLAHCVTSATTANAVGVAMNDAGDGQEITIATGGDITCDGLSLSLTGSNPVYVLSAAGAIAPASDLAASDYITIIGVAKATTTLSLAIKASGVLATA